MSSTRYLRIRALPAAVLAALSLVLALPTARADTARADTARADTARADPVRTGGEPWYRPVSADVRQRAQALFAQAVDKHLQLLRGDALALYEQALALWDNPDIQWNLALVLEDLGEYLRAYRQLENAQRWGSA